MIPIPLLRFNLSQILHFFLNQFWLLNNLNYLVLINNNGLKDIKKLFKQNFERSINVFISTSFLIINLDDCLLKLNKTIIINMFLRATTILQLVNFANIFTFARAKRNSQWIYSTKSEEMTQIHKGRIFVCSHTGNDTYNCTLRIHKAFQLAHIIFAYNPIEVSKLMKTFVKKDRFVQSSLSVEQNNSLIQLANAKQIVTYSKEKQKQIGLTASLELSKQIEMSQQVQHIYKSNNDRQNRLLKQQQEQLIKFMEVTNIRDELQTFKQTNGHSKVVSLSENIDKVEKMREGGIDMVCVIDQIHIETSKLLFRELENKKMPYQVLPASNRLINMIAATGFPADRFAIEYFPSSLEQVLIKRKPMKMTVALTLKRQELISAVQSISKIYGSEQMVYIQNDNAEIIYRGIVGESLQHMDQDSIQGSLIRIAVSPYLSTFNENLKEEKNKISKLYGEAMDESTHFVRMDFLNEELAQLLKRKDKREVQIDSMVLELLCRIKEEHKIVAIIKDVLKLGEKEANTLIKRAKKGMVMDYIGLEQMKVKK